MKHNMTSQIRYAVMLGIVMVAVAALPQLSYGDHLLPEPVTGPTIILEGESRDAANGSWGNSTENGISFTYNQSPSPGHWIQWEGVDAVTHPQEESEVWLSWTRTGNGNWMDFDLLAGPDGDNLRLVLNNRRLTATTSYVFQWGKLVDVSFLPTDSVFRVRLDNQNASSDTRIDALLITVPEPATFLYIGIAAGLVLLRRRR